MFPSSGPDVKHAFSNQMSINQMFLSINPYTEEPLAETLALSDSEWDKKLALSAKSLSSWHPLPLHKKISLVQNLKASLLKNKTKLSTLITQEMGKPIRQSQAEVEKSTRLAEYMTYQAPLVLADQKNIPLAPKGSYITFQAMGIILGIMPWNFPIWQALRFALPTLLGGNVILLKPAPNVLLLSLQLEKLFLSAGFPSGVCQVLPISHEQTGKVIADRRVRGVSLTGSVKAGRAVASLAGKHLKKVVLELGGSDPYIIRDLADLKLSAQECVHARMNNSGQSCIAAKRLLVTRKNAKKFISFVKQELLLYNKAGDPMQENTKLGPLARRDLRENLHSQVKALIKKGAVCEMGGVMPQRKGWFYPPTLLHIQAQELAYFEEELFGPVALVIVASKEEELLPLANHSPYGLGGAVFSQNKADAELWARDLVESGACAVNQALHSHPALPFGGVRDSGYGRELSTFGFYEFLNIKTITINHQV